MRYILFVLAFFTVSCSNVNESPESVVSSFLESSKKGDGERCWRSLSDRQKKFMVKMFGSETKAIKVLADEAKLYGTTKSWKTTLKKKEGARAVVEVTFSYRTGDTKKKSTFGLVFEDGHWFMDR